MPTLIAGLALLVALLALAYAWKLNQELNTATRRLDRYNKALFDAGDELRRLRSDVTESTAQLRVAIQQSQGGITFGPTTTVREAQLLHPQAAQILASFHLGGCSSCAIAPDDTLAQVCTEHGQDVGLLINNLNHLMLQGNGHRTSTPQPVKLPNVELTL
jgi:hypothetical protein